MLGLGQKFFNPRQKKTEKLSKLLKLHANKREEVRQLGAGEIGAVAGLKFTRTGDTLCEADDNISRRYSSPMTAATSTTRALPVRALVMRRMRMR